MTLHVKPKQALLVHDTQLFANMDPYIVAVVGNQKQRSSTIKGGGKRPVWKNDKFTFVAKHPVMTVNVYDEDTFEDDLVGTATIDITKFVGLTNQKQQEIRLLYKGKYAGSLTMQFRYTPVNNQPFTNYNSQPIYQNIQQNNNIPQYNPQPQPYDNNYKQFGNAIFNHGNYLWGNNNQQNGWQNQNNQSYNDNPNGKNPYGDIDLDQKKPLNEAQLKGLWGNIFQGAISQNNQSNNQAPSSNPFNIITQNSQNNGWKLPNNGW